MLPTASRSSRRPPFAGWRAATWLIVVGLLLRAGVPMLAVVAAQLRGVGVADICPVYGVRTVPVPSAAATMAMAMAGMEHGHSHQGVDPDRPDDHGEHDHHQNSAGAHDHCVLTPLLGAAAVGCAETSVLGIASGATLHGPGQRSAAAPHDAALAWYALGAHPPPPG